MDNKTISVCSSFLIFVFVASIFAFSANQNNGFLAYADPGDISDDVLATETFADDAPKPNIIHVSGDIFAIAYRDGSDCVIQTVSIDSEGTIELDIDTETFHDSGDCSDPDITHVSGDIFVIVYHVEDKGELETVSIDSEGTIELDIDTETIQVDGFEDPDIIHVSGDIFAVAYESNDPCVIQTVSIDGEGMIVDGIDTETLEGGIDDCSHVDIKHVSGDIFAIAYKESGTVETETVSISSDGTTIVVDIDVETIETDQADWPNIIHVSGDIFAIAYQSGGDGEIETISIDSDGMIEVDIDTETYDPDNGREPDIIHVSGDIFAIAYRGTSNDGIIETVSIDSEGMIELDIDTETYAPDEGKRPDILHVSGDVFAIAHRSSGHVTTISIEDGANSKGDIGDGDNDGPISTGGGSDASEYLSKPTFGLDHKTGVVQVEGGFTANGKVFDVTDNWWTDFEKQAILVGQINTFSAKAHADHVINIVEFMFGIPEVGFAHMAEASIEVTIDRDQNVTNVQVNQNDNLIDPGSVSASAVMAQCKSGDADKKCYFVTVSGIFNEALMNDVFALKGIDFLRHFHLTYLNEGFTIFGNSLNPATTLLIASNVKGSSGLMEVTQIDKINDMWVDKSGIEYERNSFDSFIRTTPIEVVRDDPMVKVMTRMNSNFETMKQNELDKATAIFDSSLIQKELPDSFTIQSAERMSKLQDPEVQLKLFIERMRADDKMNQLMQMWYAKPNPNQLN